jgi:hypothetical protein
MRERSADSPLENILAELRRIGLDPDELNGLAVADGDVDAFLAHLRSLEPGASWATALPGTPDDWRPNAPTPERALGPFDYAEPPRGPAVFASIISDDPRNTALNALARVESLSVPIFGSGVVLDRGAPHLYVVLERGASEDHVFAVVDRLRIQPGIVSSFPARWDAPS